MTAGSLEAESDKAERIRRRAYQIWQAEGCPSGRELRHWLMAAAELQETVRPRAPFSGFSVLGERSGAKARRNKGAAVDITTGREPADRTIRRTEGP